MIISNNRCSGCKACEQACPKNAINMITDDEGFWYPFINRSLCIDCGLCDKVCPAQNTKPKNEFNNIAYACINKDNEIRDKSSSGGVFYELAQYAISKHGVVFGCEMYNGNKAIHTYAENLEECKKYCGSKYVQSDIGCTYIQARNFLNANRVVLFTGTPCQIDGLILFLGKKYELLICVDIVCHGVPSPKVLTKYIDELKEEYKTKVSIKSFRDKRYGWGSYSTVLDIEEECQHWIKFSEDKYMRLFLSNIDLRPSCYNCPSNGLERRADISLADFWGVAEKYQDFDDNKGTSLVLVNSKKGNGLFAEISKNIIFQVVDLDFAIKNNPCIVKSSISHKKRDEFFMKLDKLSCEQLCEKYLKKSFAKKAMQKLKYVAKKILIKLRLI